MSIIGFNWKDEVAVKPSNDRGPSEVLDTVDAVARLYLSEAVRVQRLVEHAVGAPSSVIEDACQFAWTTLMLHRARVRVGSARGWLVRVAVREALALMRRDRREPSLEALAQAPPVRSAGDRRPGPDVGRLTAPSLMDDLVEQRSRLAAIGALPERQQRLVWLQGFGFSYREMSGQTGLTQRTVERQLLRAKRTLGQARP